MNFDLIIPASTEDIVLAIEKLNRINICLNPKKICLISNLSAKKEFDKRMNLPDNVVFIDENSMINGLSFEVIREYLQQFGAEKRTGWYFQQFLKMAYALVCTENFYLSWDADTIPLRKIYFFDDDKPIFSMKKEYNAPYFKTIKKLFDLEKSVSDSFISEYMMFDCQIMNELISGISGKYGTEWYLNIIDAIDENDLGKSGFSEFETYGTYVINHYPGRYCCESVNAIRTGKKYFGTCPSEDVLNWLGQYYSTISFEQWDEQRIHTRFYNNSMVRSLLQPSSYIKICNSICRIKNKLNSIASGQTAGKLGHMQSK